MRTPEPSNRVKRTMHVLASFFALLLVVGLFSIYWQVRNIDPEGACKEFKYFSRCWDAWFNYHPADTFKKLPTDQQMIDSFNQYRHDFDEAKEQAMSHYHMSFLDNPVWKKRHGIDYFHLMAPWSRSILESNGFIEPDNGREWAYEFHVASTMYIAGAGKEWPWVNRLKGYVYFPLPEPQIEHGRLQGAILKKRNERMSWRVLEQLDGNWPEDWASLECLLRRIEPQWFLFLCKDRVGG